MRQWTAFALMLITAAALGGCRDEDGRVLAFDKGEYGGPPIPDAPPQAAEGWRARTEKMRY